MYTRLPERYVPSDDEPFMNDRQKEYFRRKLCAWREDILQNIAATRSGLQHDDLFQPDPADRARKESDRAIEIKTRDRQRKLIDKIDAALRRLEEGTYGYCEVTGEPISIKRLEARPVATLSLEAQVQHEIRERTHSEE